MKKPISIKKFLRYFFSLACYFILSNLDGKYSPFSLALLTSNLIVGLKPLTSFLLYLTPYLLSFSPRVILYSACGGGAITIAFFLYKKYKKNPSFELVGILVVALIPFALLSPVAITLKITVSASIIFLSFTLTAGVRVWLVKGLCYKLSIGEIFSASLLLILCEYGLIIALGEGFCFAFAILAVLFTTMFFNDFSPLFTGLITSIPLVLSRLSFFPISVLSIYSISLLLTSKYSRLLTGILTFLLSVCFYFFTNFFASYSNFDFIVLFTVILVYLFLPTREIERIKDNIKINKSSNLSRYSVNFTRSTLSSKLYEMSSVFEEMALSVEKLESGGKREDVKQKLLSEIINSVCKKCENYSTCNLYKNGDGTFFKIIELGLAKGKLSLTDIPKNFSIKCKNLENVLFRSNELFVLCENDIKQKQSIEYGKELIVYQTRGVADSLKSLAFDLSRQIECYPSVGKEIEANLLSCGIFVKEVFCFLDGDLKQVELVLQKNDAFSPILLKSVGEIVGYKPIITDTRSLSQNLIAITLKPEPTFDAVFGIAQRTKDGMEKSGDTHSVTRISEGKFLVALNDGMGSGTLAEDTSATAISLVETFYKAGIKSETVLSTVNKILTFGNEDNFTALDIGVIDLFSGLADFIKIGSPFSFIITSSSVKIIEGNSLPLGILDEMNPTTCRTKLSSGDVIVFVSDGISDAFSSSSDLITFLSNERAVNPKTLADNVLEKALSLSDGKANDDMTVFCIRLFSKN